MLKTMVLGILLGLIMMPAATASEPTDLSGVYEYQGNLRNATVSKLEIKKLNGQHRIHVWFYGRPDDVDWGEVAATEYKRATASRTPDLLATLQYGTAKAIVSVRVWGASNEKISLLKVQSWVSYAHPDERHQNEAAEDNLVPKD